MSPRTKSPDSPPAPDNDERGDVLVDTETRTKKPALYRVVMLNDDFTPMEFVVYVLTKFFSKSETQAAQIMLRVHRDGRALVGVYPRSVAEARTAQVNAFSRNNGHPLKCVFEKEDGDAD